MKITIHRCDFCGGKKPPATMSQLIIPLTEEDKALRKRMRKTVGDDDEEPRHTMFHPIYGIVREAIPTTTTMEMCADCTQALLSGRSREIRRMLTEEPK